MNYKIYASILEDEAPFAYKDWEIIAEAIGPTATILDHLHPIFNFKAQS